MAAALNNTNPLDFPRYVRSLRPALPESLPTYVDDELDKLSTSLQRLEEATNNFASARVEEERIVRVSEDEALAARIVTVEAEFTAAQAETNARLTTEEIARATADEAIASRVTTVEAEYKAADAETEAKVTVEEIARATADEALSARIEAVEADFRNEVSATNARVSQESYARATEDEAIAEQITVVETTLDGHTASITTQQTSINGLYLKYGVKLDSNGYVTGFEQNNNGTTGDFTIRADTFRVVMPGYGSVTPFQVDSGGVRINGNLVVTGSITTNGLASGAVTDTVAAGGSFTSISGSGNSGFTLVSTARTGSAATGAKVVGFASCYFNLTAASSDCVVNAYLYKNGAAVNNAYFVVPAGQTLTTFPTFFGIDTSPSGSNTYSVYVAIDSAGSYTGTGRADLLVQELKR